MRLGSALADYIRRRVEESGSDSGYFLVEGVPASVAEGMTRAWDSTMPELAVGSAQPHRFGRYALRDVSGTYLRNRSGTHGVVLVMCDGEQVPDRQSLSQFESVSPSVLLDTPEGMGILSQQQPVVNQTWIIHPVWINHDSSRQTAQFNQVMPVPTVPSQP